jgi:phosphoribosylformimino-5-aminoimidazole carboxamide ribotide isomerase
VRLYQGDFGKETAYGTDPVTVARSFAAAGVRWIHVVDLDAARTGEPANRDVVGAIAQAVAPDVSVQSGGGVRDRAAAHALVAAGVARVVMGTAALESPELVAEVAAEVPLAVSLDGRGGALAARGWTEASRSAADVLTELAGLPLAALVVTEITRDGTLAGPDVDGLAGVLEATDLPVIASGGVGSLADLESLASLTAGARRLAGAIVGKALYEGVFTIEEAVAACAASA